jgi:hypothetical protein
MIVLSVAVPLLGGATIVAVTHADQTVAGSARAAATDEEFDADQIRVVLADAQNAYNRSDIQGLEATLCRDALARWDGLRELAWHTFRVKKGAGTLSVDSITLYGDTAQVLATQTYASDNKRRHVTVIMGREGGQWKMCETE